MTVAGDICVVDQCQNKSHRQGRLCSKHRARQWRHGSPDGYASIYLGPRDASVMQRLIAGISDDSDCWLWGRTISGNGYGHMQEDGRRVGVHRLMWEAVHQMPVPVGMDVCHSCDVRRCINPSHLWIGTRSDNVRDMDAKGRRYGDLAPRVHCPQCGRAFKRVSQHIRLSHKVTAP